MVTKIIIVFLVVALGFAGGAAVLFWMEIQEFEPEVYHYVPQERSFIYQVEDGAGYGFEEYIKDKINTEKARLIDQKRNFIYVDLHEMELILYKEGEVFENFEVKSKGKEGSFWETSPGAYFVGDKVVRHFSTVSRVWMPYAIQFYGNFFIHGWPYDNLGRSLSLGPSGGCIRLLTADAAIVYEFAERGMPILVFEKKPSSILPALLPSKEEIIFPELSGQSVIAADLATGEIILSKDIYSEIHAGVVARGILALAASEIVSLERRMMARSWMIEDTREGIIVPNRSYSLQELIGPLLGRASREAALVLSRFFTEEYFLGAMNAKARAIGMDNTVFVDVAGISQDNTTTLFDAARMMRYIKDYRGFLFNISDQWPSRGSGNKEAVFKILKAEHKQIPRSVFIGIADSEDALVDLENIIIWLREELDLK